jgi:hypothetical protein
MRRTFLQGAALLAAASIGCTGQIGEPGSDGRTAGGDPAAGYDPAFNTQDEQPQLLPFWVRLERVAAVVGRTTDDPMFDELKQNRLLLGDYDYASGVKPDRMWTPARMTLWAKSLRPVCASDAMRALYPALGTDGSEVAALASDAWGRGVEASELPMDGGATAQLGDAQRYEVACLSVLSATEFVIQ